LTIEVELILGDPETGIREIKAKLITTIYGMFGRIALT